MATPGFSVGDIIASIKLVKDVIKALRSTCGAGNEYVDLAFELYGLQDALREVQILHPQLDQGSLQSSLAAAAQKCQATIDSFVEGLKKYQPYLGNPNGESSSWRGALRKIQWQMCKKDDIVHFRAKIGSHTHSIQMLLLRYQIKTARLQRKTLEEHDADLKDNTERLKQLEEAVRETKTEYGQLCRDVEDSITGIAKIEQMGQTMIASNYQTLTLLESLCKSIPAQVLLQNPVIFRDALDRVAPIHLDWIDSREAFLAVLRLLFQDVGTQKIRRGEFILQDAATGDIDLSRPWKVCFSPGQRVDMAVTSKRRETVGNVTCPVCGHENIGDASSEIECERCHRTFHRVLELDDDGNSQTGRLNAPFGERSPISETSRKRRKRKRGRDTDVDDVDESLRLFRRVRILCKKEPQAERIGTSLSFSRSTESPHGNIRATMDWFSDQHQEPFNHEVTRTPDFPYGPSFAGVVPSTLPDSAATPTSTAIEEGMTKIRLNLDGIFVLQGIELRGIEHSGSIINEGLRLSTDPHYSKADALHKSRIRPFTLELSEGVERGTMINHPDGYTQDVRWVGNITFH